MTYVVSILVFVLLAVGLYLRKRKHAWHFRVMIAAFVVDLATLAMMVLGWRRLRGSHTTAPVHRKVGITFRALRSLTYITSFVV